tara:strand:- start:3022 stop:5433 length:2412 start_codon:yes stop_codon:yes gene_type:complete
LDVILLEISNQPFTMGCHTLTCGIESLVDSQTNCTAPDFLDGDVCDASRPGLFEGDGAEMDYARCMALHPSPFDYVLTLYSRSTVRHMLCPVEALFAASVSTTADTDAPPTVAALLRGAACAWILAGGIALARVRGTGSVARRLGRHAWKTCAWWCVLLALMTPLALWRDRTSDMYDFYIHDEHSRCAFDILRSHPGAVANTRLLSVLAPSVADMRRTLIDVVLAERVDGAPPLSAVCGYCGLQCLSRTDGDDDFRVARAVVLGEEYDSDVRDAAEPVLCSIVLPDRDVVNQTWPRRFSQRLVERDVTFLSVEQFQVDLQASLSTQTGLMVTSTLTLVAITYAALRSVRLTVACVFWLTCSIVIADGLGAALGIGHSPWNMLIAPIAIGVGSDAMFILHQQFLRGGTGWVDRAFPSILASYATTTSTFLVGLLIAVPHLRRFFASCVLCMTTVLTMQYTLFPLCIRRCVDASCDEVPKLRPSPRLCKAAWAVLCAYAVLVAGGSERTVASKFDLGSQLAGGTRTHRVLEYMSAHGTRARAPVYVKFDLDDPGARDAVHAASVGMEPLFDWTLEFDGDLANAASLDAWLQKPFNRARFNSLVSARSGVAVYTAPFATTATTEEDAAFVRGLVRGEGVCAASFERLGPYTLQRLLHFVAWLCGVSLAVTGVFAVMLGGPRALAVLVSVLGTYALLLGTLALLRINVTFMVASCLIILPGLVVDFSLHLCFDLHTTRAVCFTAASSVGSMLPYLASPLQGVRSFAQVYVAAIAIGALAGIASTAVKRAEYERLRADASEMTPVMQR